MRLTLPWPPSMNHYWRTRVIGKGKSAFVSTYVSGDGKAFQRDVIAAIKTELGSVQPIAGRVAVAVTLHQPDRRRCDIDNRVKPLLDALTAAGVWTDDSQVDELRIRRGEIRKGAACCEVVINELVRVGGLFE